MPFRQLPAPRRRATPPDSQGKIVRIMDIYFLRHANAGEPKFIPPRMRSGRSTSWESSSPTMWDVPWRR